MNTKKLTKLVKRIKHFFIQTKAAINIDGIKWDIEIIGDGITSYQIRIPYHSLSKGFYRFLNLITIGEKYEISRMTNYYEIEFTEIDDEDPEDENDEEDIDYGIGTQTETSV